jgi:hypothetical protein
MAMTKKQRQAAARKAARTRSKTKNKKKNGKTNALTKAWGKITTAAGGVVTLQLITGSDMAASTGQPIAIRSKNFLNSLVGRVTGYSPFASTANAGGQIPQTLSIEGMFNKYTGIALGLIGYSMIPAKILPHKSKAKSLGRKVLGGALLGGLFKPSTNPHNTNLISQTHSTPMVQNVGVLG